MLLIAIQPGGSALGGRVRAEPSIAKPTLSVIGHSASPSISLAHKGSIGQKLKHHRFPISRRRRMKRTTSTW